MGVPMGPPSITSPAHSIFPHSDLPQLALSLALGWCRSWVQTPWVGGHSLFNTANSEGVVNVPYGIFATLLGQHKGLPPAQCNIWIALSVKLHTKGKGRCQQACLYCTEK